jgi:hypothetical protein
MFPVNDNYFWSSIYLSRLDIDIELVIQIPEEKFSIELKTVVKLHTNTSFRKVEKHTLAHNMTHSFNEVSIEWNDEKILWKLNDQLINDVDLKKFLASNTQIFDNTLILVMTLKLRPGSYNDSNFNLSNIHKPYLYIDYVRAYKPKKNATTPFPNAKKIEIDSHSNLGANNANSFLNTNKTIPLINYFSFFLNIIRFTKVPRAKGANS